MTHDNATMLSEFMQNNSEDTLKFIRDGFLKDLPFDQLLDEDKEVCKEIDNYFKQKAKAIELAHEKARNYEGYASHNFTVDIFEVQAETFSKRVRSVEPHMFEIETEVLEIILTTQYE